MTWLEAITLGVVQGLTEFLPISSSAHVSVVGQLCNWGDPGAAFTAVTQLGTEAAVLVYFRHDIARIVKRWFAAWRGKVPWSDPDARMGWLVIVGSVPIVVFGFVLQDFIRGTLRNLWLTASMLAIFALVLALADKMAKNQKTLEKLTWRNGILFGFAQAMALIPGVSRSGGTIAAGLFMGFTREAAARYSFLLAIPAVLGSGLYELLKFMDEPEVLALGPTAVATLISFGVGYAVIAWLLKYVTTHNFSLFVWYRLALAAVLFALLGFGVIQSTS